MPEKIYKYELEVTNVQTIDMPVGAKILCIQLQNFMPCIWALVDPDMPKERRTIEIFGTGHDVPDKGERKYIGTYQLMNGALVYHCFELLI